MALCLDEDGPQMYLAAVQDDIALLGQFCGCSSYEGYYQLFSALKFTKLGVNRKYEGSKEKQEQVKKIRKTMKDALGKVQNSYFYQDKGQTLTDIAQILPDVEALVQLTLAFAQAYRLEKEARSLLDFSDIEHFALDILVDRQTKEPTAAARELRGVYEEIMIDEYQDSNYVQEAILKAVSRESIGQNNIFMVGDVKQSIYRFRLARPELFIEKYKTYSTQESSRQKIDLHKNFRSRPEVLDSINYLFYQIMHEDLGKVEYDAQAALYAGASYPNPQEGPIQEGPAQENFQPGMPVQPFFQTELLLAQADAEELADFGMKNWQELEAHMVAARIKEMLETQFVTDKESGKLRKARCRDIVVLLRSITGWADVFLKVFAQSGIPAHTTSQSGYFGTVEIQTILSMLSVLDNPLQDIPLAAVLASPIGGLDGEELAQVKAGCQGNFYYLALLSYVQPFTQPDDAASPLQNKILRFLQMYKKLRSLTAYTPIHQLIQAVLQETGYASYIQAMPAGRQRRANVDMLLEKAVAYEKTSYKGLFHFVRYIEKLQKYEIDFGEADITSENEDVVRIMSIHKSKGLEFPVVFACGMAKQFNRQDIRSRLVLHPEYGIGLDCIDADKRIRKTGFIKKILENEIGIENQGEELRILYVALTRAKEKLVLAGAVKEEAMPASQAAASSQPAPMDYFSRLQASCYLDWIYPCAAAGQGLYQLRVYRPGDIRLQAAVEAAAGYLDQRQVYRLYQEAGRKQYETLDKRLSWKYPYEGDTDLKTKISVSELKRRQDMARYEEEIPAEEWFPKEQEAIVPAFIRSDEKKQGQGALRGSAVHKVLEEVDFVRSIRSENRTADIKSQMEEMLAKQHITPQMQKLVNPRMLGRFLDSPLAARMALAQGRGQLYKEQPFVMGLPASRVYEGASGELLLIQGIVDACWVEDGKLVILDYKTDSVQAASQLVQRYAVQLGLYAEALQKAAGMEVKEKLVYSFHLQETVPIMG